MKSNKLVSIVIPCYQQQKLLLRCLKSITKQTYSNIEVIVIDDGSEPAIEISVGDYVFPLAVIRQNNKGLSNARNTGLAKAKGKYIKFLDADDELLPNCIFDQVNSLPDNNDFMSVIGYIEHQEETQREDSIIPAFTDGLSAILLVNIGPPHAYLFTTESVNQIGGFHEGDRIDGGHEDYDLVFRMLISGLSITTVHKTGVIYYKRSGTMSTVKDKMDRTRAEVWCYNVRNLCLQKEKKTHKVIMSLLTGYCFLLEVTSTKCLKPLLEIEKNIIKTLNEFALQGVDSELSSISKRLSNTKLVPKLNTVLIGLVDDVIVPPVTINAQEINDYRVSLLQRNGILPTLDWLQEILEQVMSHDGPIAVYGAGELGRKITNLLCTINRAPSILFDRGYKDIESINGIKVLSPDDISEHDLSLIVIASLSFRNEIKSQLSIYPNLKKI